MYMCCILCFDIIMLLSAHVVMLYRLHMLSAQFDMWRVKLNSPSVDHKIFIIYLSGLISDKFAVKKLQSKTQ